MIVLCGGLLWPPQSEWGEQMFNLTECHFIYNDINSRTYDLVVAHIDSEEFRPVFGAKEGVYIFNKATKSRHIISDRYEDSPLMCEVEIVRCDGTPFNKTELREIERWLFTNSKYRKLYIDPVDDPLGETYEISNGQQVQTYLNCRFVNAEKIFGNGGVIGFRCDIETDSYLAWQDVTVGFYVANNPEKIVEIGGVTKHILLGDPLLDGEIGPDDSKFALDYYTYRTLGHHTLNESIALLSAKYNCEVTMDQIIACDMQFVESDYEDIINGLKEPEVDAYDPQTILDIYTSNIAGHAGEKKYVDPTTGAIVVDHNVRIVPVSVDSDVDGYTYPVITIQTGSIGGDIEVTNTSERVRPYLMNSYRRFVLNTQPNTEYVIDSTISSYSPLGVDIRSGEFPRLMNGDNTLNFAGNVRSIKIEWNNRRFL